MVTGYKELINDSLSKVQNGVDLIEKSGQSQEENVDSVSRVGSIAAEIAVASQEQSEGSEPVNAAVTSLDDMTQQNAALADETSKTALSLNDQAVEMGQLMGFFSVETSGDSNTDGVAESAVVIQHESAAVGSMAWQAATAEPVSVSGPGRGDVEPSTPIDVLAPAAAGDDFDWEEF